MNQRKWCTFWSGGKDSFLAFLDVWMQHPQPKDHLFVTFVPKEGNFLCHPLPILEKHSAHFHIRHEFIVIDEEVWQTQYKLAIAFLRNTYGITDIITGDVFANADQYNAYWLRTLLDDTCVRLHSPIFGDISSAKLLDCLSKNQIVSLVTGVALPQLIQYVGKPLQSRMLETASLEGWLHPHGENGEFHTTVGSWQGTMFCPADMDFLPVIFNRGLWTINLSPQLSNFRSKRLILT